MHLSRSSAADATERVRDPDETQPVPLSDLPDWWPARCNHGFQRRCRPPRKILHNRSDLFLGPRLLLWVPRRLPEPPPHRIADRVYGRLENAQAIAAHESPRTTMLYDHSGDEITLDEVERIGI